MKSIIDTMDDVRIADVNSTFMNSYDLEKNLLQQDIRVLERVVKDKEYSGISRHIESIFIYRDKIVIHHWDHKSKLTLTRSDYLKEYRKDKLNELGI